jgi:phenylpyruvate tautomerase PptA (4-oxalocrotonate tautomerase family)
MRADQLTEVFQKQLGARKDGAALLVPEAAEASVFVGLEGETLAIARVVRLEVADTLVVIDTAKGDRFVIAAEDVRAVKIDRTESSRRGGAAGFK